jgi:tetratricopeptide (TPR) repeat protein
MNDSNLIAGNKEDQLFFVTFNDSVVSAYSYMTKRKFKEAIQECELALKMIPNSKVAQSLHSMIDERKDLYQKGGWSIFFGLMLFWRLAPSSASGSTTLTSVGYMALALSVFMLVSGFFVSLSGLRLGFLVDSITFCVVGLWNLGVSLFVRNIDTTALAFAGLGVFQIILGISSYLKYSQKNRLNYKEVVDQIANLPEFSDNYAKEVSPQALDELSAAFKAYRNDKKPKDILALCESALSLEPNLSLAHYLRGVVLVDLKRRDDAIVAYQKALELDPSLSTAQEHLSDLESKIRKKK